MICENGYTIVIQSVCMWNKEETMEEQHKARSIDPSFIEAEIRKILYNQFNYRIRFFPSSPLRIVYNIRVQILLSHDQETE